MFFMRKNAYIYISLLLFILGGCTYSVYMNAFPHLKTVKVEDFSNDSKEFGIEENLTDILVEDFEKNNQLELVSVSPDVSIQGTVLDYKREVLTFTESDNVEEYKVTILFSLKVIDNVQDKVIWDGKSVLISRNYANQVSEEDSGTIMTSEEEAQTAIFNELYNEIMKNTFEKW